MATELVPENDMIVPMLEELNSALEGDEIPAHINSLIDKCSLNLSSLAQYNGDATRILVNIKRILLESSMVPNVDYNSLIELLENVIKVCSFEDVLEIYSIDDLTKALQSKNSLLISCLLYTSRCV